MKIYKRIVSLLICIILVLGLSIVASAGSAIVNLDNSSFANDELSTQDWHNANEDIVVKKGKIIFPKDSSSGTKLVWKSPTVKSSYYDKLVEGSTTFKLTKLPAGETFALAFALKTIEPEIGSANTLELQFKNKGGIYASVVSYDADANPTTISSTKRVGSVGANLSVTFTITTDDKITLSINGTSLCKNANIKHTGEGRIGFIQTDGCVAEISAVNFKSYAYDTPENVNFSEDFNDSEWNINHFTSTMVAAVDYPGCADIQEYNGQKGMLWQNGRFVYLSTKYTYSNFEFSFDVPYQQNHTILDDEGNLVTRPMPYYYVRTGCESNEMEAINWSPSAYSKQVVLGNGNYLTVYSGSQHDGTFTKEGFNFFDEATSRKGYSLKFVMKDGVFTGYAKWMDEKSFGDPVFTVDQSDAPTPTGFIQIIGLDYTNMMIDNVKVKNLDYDPNLVEVDFLTNKEPFPEDYKYTPMDVVYMPQNNTEEEVGFNFWLIPAIAAGVAVIAVGVTVLVSAIARKKRIKKAGETVDE